MKRIAALLLLLRALPCLAQQGATSELTGRVTTAGQPLPGVTVTVRSDSLQGNRFAVTGENGGYLFALVPPADYQLRFDLEGFTAVERHVRVSLAATTRVDIDLTPAPLLETVNVESDRARVPANTSIGMNLRAAELQRLPGGRDIHAAVLLSPSAGVQGPNNRLAIAGAPSWESLFLVDGVVVNEYLSGQPHNLFIEDAIQEIAVLTGAVSAEYGRFTGGVVSTLTKAGGNDLRGSLRDTLTNAAWTNRTPWAGQPEPINKVNNGIEGTLGGYLVKDRTWFFAATRKARASLGSFTALTNIGYRVESRDDRWDVKVTQHISGGQSLVASWIDTSLADTNAIDPDRGGKVADLTSLIPRRRQSAQLLALTYEGVLAANTFAEIHGSHKRYALRDNGGGSSDPILGTVIVVRSLGVNLNAPIGCGICGPDQRDSSTWAAKGSHYQNTRWGNHTTVAGADWFHEDRANGGSRSASEFNIQENTPAQVVAGSGIFPVFDATTAIFWTHPIAGSHATDQNTWSGYVNDRWDIASRLTVNLGARYDRNNVKDAVGRIVSNDNAYSPRVGATFDLRNDGRHRLIASYGRYTAKILDGGGNPQQVGTFTEMSWRYRGTPINTMRTPPNELLPAPEALARLFAWFDAIGGVQNRQYGFFTDPRYTSEFRHSLKSPAVDEWSAGYALQMSRAVLRADYIARDWHHFYAARVDTTTGQTTGPAGKMLDVASIVNNDSGTVRTYRAIQLQGSWRYRRVTAGGGYTWSTLRGNDDEDDGTTNSPRNLPLRLWYPEFLGYPQRRPIGYLARDQRNRSRVWAGYEMPMSRASLSAFLIQRFESGLPYSAVANIDPTGGSGTYQGMPLNPGYALNQAHMGQYFFSKRGAFRTDDIFSTDLAVNYEIRYRSFRLIFKGDVLNLFDNAAVVSPDTLVTTGFSGDGSGLQRFNPFTQRPVEGVNYRRGPNFGKATGPESYQTPRTFQLSFGARF